MDGQLEQRRAVDTAKRLEFYLSEAESTELRTHRSSSDKMCLAAWDACLTIRNIVNDIAQDAAFAFKVGSQLLKDGVSTREVGFFLPGATVEYSKDGKHRPSAIEFGTIQAYSENPTNAQSGLYRFSDAEYWLERDETTCPNNEYMQKLYWKGMLHKKIGTEDISQNEHKDISEWLSLTPKQRGIEY